VADGPDRSNNRTVVVIALTGLLSTVGAAFLGGVLANNAVESQLYIARDTAIKDQRRQIYVDYLRATAKVCEIAGGGDDKAINAAGVDVLNQQARVLLIAGPAMEKAVDNFTEQLVLNETAGRTDDNPCDLAAYRKLRDAFISAAKPDLQE